MKQKNLDFRFGVDFNRSTVKNFQIINGQILIPFSALTGIGEVVAKKITDYRQKKGQINFSTLRVSIYEYSKSYNIKNLNLNIKAKILYKQ